jgi:hypothetical protein
MHNRVVAVKGMYLGDEVYFAKDERWARSLEGDGLVIYTLAETEMVKWLDNPTKRLIHEAKRQGGIVVARESTSE